MSSLGYYDRDARPIDFEKWVALRQHALLDESYLRVASTQLGEVWISTVWMGIDHNFAEVGPPLIFETMIFPECAYCERTPTEAAALAAHDQAVAHVESGAYAAAASLTEQKD